MHYTPESIEQLNCCCIQQLNWAQLLSCLAITPAEQ
jgi:hypothetical protein